MDFQIGDWVYVSNCCRGRIIETNGHAAMVEIDTENDRDILYVDYEELQLAEG